MSHSFGKGAKPSPHILSLAIMAPVKKRIKRHQKTSNYVVSALKPRILDMPVDILLEASIFHLLHPADLVYLTRTSKAFRSFLLDRTKCLRIWQNALGHVEDLPGCPSFISEPAYANLVFIPLCHGCGFSCETILWRMRIRCCDDCCKTLLARTQDCKKLLPQKLFKADKELWIKLFPYQYFPGRPSRFLKADIQVFKEQYKSIRDHDNSKDIIEYRQALTKEINAVIVTRLTTLGWGDELKMVERGRYCYEFNDLPVVAKVAPIEAKEWRKIEAVLVTFLENHRTRRPSIALKEAYRRRFLSLSSICHRTKVRVFEDMIKQGVNRVGPATFDIFFIPQGRELLEVDIDNFNLKDVEAKLSSMLPSLLTHWYNDMMAQFQNYVRSRDNTRNGIDPFERAVQVFKCKKCLETLHYVIGHHCLALNPLQISTSDDVSMAKWKRSNGKAMETDRGALYGAAATELYQQRPWTWEYLDVKPWRKRIKNLFEALGEDFTTVTKETMLHCGLRVSCDSCQSQIGMQWQAAVGEHVVYIPYVFN
ncbi:hypothetical protein BJ138DRAFT_1107954 [Hygrophoropsis aurantiaca]|uniref:Uncharacterized protein n=1 Tax=Hygrophoropsis aurantiaca TaxID=72124 RepID=A0ACB7ZQZ1_9AGAM|nr:hypothetical protein BJ138DRAFT_1107954 [Hygrophoropsis aurantiaca]